MRRKPLLFAINRIIAAFRRTLAAGLTLAALLTPAIARAQKEQGACGCAGIPQTGEKESPLRMLLDTATYISSVFGPRLSPIFGTPEMHTGVDIAAPAARPFTPLLMA